MITFEELSQRFPVKDVAPYGACVVVPGAEFDPDWEVALDDQGYQCIMTDLDSHAVTLVQKKRVAEGKVVYVPPRKVDVESNPAVEKKVYVLKGPAWTKEDAAELLRAYDGLVLEGKKYGSNKIIAELPRFKGRTLEAVTQKLKKLREKRSVKGEDSASSVTEKAAKIVDVKEALRARARGGNLWLKVWSVEEDELLIELWNRKPKLTVAEIAAGFCVRFPERSAGAVGNRVSALQVEGRIQPRFKTKRKGAKAPEKKIAEDAKSVKVEGPFSSKGEAEESSEIKTLFEVYDALSKDHVALKTDFKKLEARVDELAGACTYIPELQENLTKHKHAQGSGEAMLPMEASS